MLLIKQTDTVNGLKQVRKKPIIIHAKQIDEDFDVESLEGVFKASAGDYLMRGFNGEYYSCKKEIFEATYDILESVRSTESGI